MLKSFLILILLGFLTINISESIDLHGCYKKTFKVSNYYSVISGQKFYYKGSFYKEKKLNGNGIHGASGKTVFNGMIAAPKNYKFGTKIYFPGLGVGQVEDRGNAIVNSGKRGEKYDRIDIWVGQGDEALMRALSFGKQVRVGYICPPMKKLKVGFNYSSFPIFKNFFKKTIWGIGMYLGRKDNWVVTLQNYLRVLGYFHYYKSTGYFGSITKQAVAKFQKDNGIKTNYYGYFGPKTRSMLKNKLKKKGLYKNTNNYVKNKPVLATLKKEKKKELVLSDLKVLKRGLGKGYNTYEVKILQKYLKKMGYYNGDVNGYYGDETIKAVVKFQFKYGIINKSNKYLAGYFGPLTRSTFKKAVLKRIINS